jgi:spermidine synthase
MGGLVLYVVVSISGASILAIEILGTRILGPFYGVSLFLWSALISVTLAALSVGYALGGRWADRGPRMARLAWILAVAGIWMVLIPWIRNPVLLLVEPMGLRAAVLVAAFVLFAPPLTLLGMVSPYAIKLRTHSLGEVGRTAGDIYAISTVASVVAALLTGFVLIPNVGVRRLTILIGVLLILGAALSLLVGRRQRGNAVLAALLMVVGIGGLAFMPRVVPRAHGSLLAVTQSPYAEIRVVDKNGDRFLLIDGSAHTFVNPETWESYYRYVVALDVAKMLFPQPGKALVIGLGGGSVVKDLAKSHWGVDAVEIDPEVVRLAGEYFGLEPDEASVYRMDGRRFLLTHPAPYDLIIMDAFGSSEIPFHLITKEYFGLVKAHLSPGGIFAVNLETRGWHDVIVRSVAATLKQEFAHVVALPTQEPPNTLGNVVLLASDRKMELADDAIPHPVEFLYDDYLHWVVVQMNHAWNNRFEPDTKGARVLTDDLNPVDVWGEEINLAARRELHDYFDPKDLGW